MTDGTEFRAVSAADERAVAALLGDAWRAAYHGLLPDELLQAAAVEGLVGRRARPRGAERGWVLEEDGAPVAYACAGPEEGADPAACEVYAFYVAPGRQGAGLGRRLMEHLLRELARLGFREARLWSLVGNAPAEAFYRALGWLQEGEVALLEVRGHRLPHRRLHRST